MSWKPTEELVGLLDAFKMSELPFKDFVVAACVVALRLHEHCLEHDGKKFQERKAHFQSELSKTKKQHELIAIIKSSLQHAVK
eukprot:7352708-Pyramimonas_sp.AAC.1